MEGALTPSHFLFKGETNIPATNRHSRIGAARALHRRSRNKPRGTHLEKIKAAMRGNKFRQGLPAWNAGMPWANETKEKMRQAKLGKSTSAKHKANTSVAIKKWWAKRKQEGVSSETQVILSNN